MTDALPGPPAGPKNSLVKLLIPVGLLTLIAAAAGLALGAYMIRSRSPAREAASSAAPAISPLYGGDTGVLELKPIVTNLAAPANAWIRLQTAMIYDRKAVAAPEATAAEIGTDILGYLKTLSLAQLQGASGLLHLREDLNERAAIRSDGHVREMALEMLVVQ